MARGLHQLERVSRLRCLAVLIAALATGCLAPPPIEEEPTVEHAPEIVPELVLPQEVLVSVNLLENPIVEFSVESAVSDEDGDPIYTYWYLLPTENDTSQTPLRSNRRTFGYVPCASEFQGLLPVPPPDPPRLFVELDVTDRPRTQGEDGGELQAPREYPPEANVTTLKWVLLFSGTCR